MSTKNINEICVEKTQTVKEFLSQFILTSTFTSKAFLDFKVADLNEVVTINSKVIDSIIKFIIKNNEGGYVSAEKAASFGDTGGETNFGIAKNYNPEVDVKNLTIDGAVAIYKRKFVPYVPKEITDPNLYYQVLDMSINAGPGGVKRTYYSGISIAEYKAARLKYYSTRSLWSNLNVRKSWTNRTNRNFTDVNLKTGLVDKSKIITNQDKILSNYNKAEYDEAINQTDYNSFIIKSGTTVGLPNGVIKRQMIKSDALPDLVQLTEYKPFIAKALLDLFADPNYVQVIKGQNGQDLSRQQINDISVYIWVRSATYPNDNSQVGTWYNISPHIDYLETNVNAQLGSFSLSLQPVLGIYDKQFGWTLGDSEVVSASISKYEIKGDNFLRRNDFFFEKILQENDLIYIKFEGLKSEERYLERASSLTDRSFYLSSAFVPGQIWDMIGLIDGVSVGGTNRSVNTTVYGRDLMKLLIEDGSIFFPEQIGQQIFNNPDSILTKRNLIEAEARFLSAAAITFKPVHTILKYVFNKFSNIGLVPSSVFDIYGTNANRKKYNIITDNTALENLNDRFLQEERQGIWRIIEFVFDPSAANRVLADSSISTDNGSLINSIKKVCQEPFVEFRGDTYGDKYYFIVRKMPFDSVGYRGMVYKDIDHEKINDELNTLSDVILVKKKLFGLKKNIGSEFKRKNESINNKNVSLIYNRSALLSDLVIDIDEVDVISDNLQYSSEAYSWYRILPRGLGITEDTASFALASIVSFDEYAEVFGNKAYELEYNYSPTEFIDNSISQKQMKYAEAQAFLDLQYMVQSHAYLPFTRQGTIVINGDRRIKTGMMIYYVPTDEVFYVDAVKNVRTLNDRYTVLTVSRGMREKYIKGKFVEFGGKAERVSYFDIINTDVDTNASINNTAFLKNWEVNKNVFNFFLQRRQWGE